MDILLIISVAFAGAFLSFFSGFGLGTLLLPAFLLFFPPQVAIAATAVVHMLNNLFKLYLVGRYADRSILISFGFLSILGALAGAWIMGKLAHDDQVLHYSVWGYQGNVTPVNLTVGLLILVFTLLELSPAFQRWNIPRSWMPVGGWVSGFFGGLSGHQGALRSAFLMKAGLSKEAFMGSRVVLACMVDLTRISVYFAMMKDGWGRLDIPMVSVATLAAFTGAWVGNRYMHRTDWVFIERIITVSLIVFSIALMLGWI